MGKQKVKGSQLQCGHGSDAVETLRGFHIQKEARKLQCGHGSDAVETESARRGDDPQVRLQCGHGSDAVETVPVSGRRHLFGAASMRPRQ